MVEILCYIIDFETFAKIKDHGTCHDFLIWILCRVFIVILRCFYLNNFNVNDQHVLDGQQVQN